MTGSLQQADRFASNETEFQLGALPTEQGHPLTADVSRQARADLPAAVRAFFAVDRSMFETLAAPNVAEAISDLADAMTATVRAGGRIFFTGCGSTGRLAILLESMWRKALRRLGRAHPARGRELLRMCDAVCSVMAGGDYAFIKAVEGYEDLPVFGRRQMRDAGLDRGDLVVAITEGGETSFVIGTAWAGVEAGAGAWFVYNNPDPVLRRFRRCREVLECDRIRKLCLATGPMAISGSTRMQATTAEFAVVGRALEAALAGLTGARDSRGPHVAGGTDLVDALQSQENLHAVCGLIRFEEAIYRGAGLLTYLADAYSPDLLTDTTERAPTFSVPAFARAGDDTATPSWAYLATPQADNAAAWRGLLGRDIRAVDWTADKIAAMLTEEEKSFVRTFPRIGRDEVLRFDISRSAARRRLRSADDGLLIFLVGDEAEDVRLLDSAARAVRGAAVVTERCGVCFQGSADEFARLQPRLHTFGPGLRVFPWIVSECGGPFDLTGHLAFKMIMNLASSATMCLMDRVVGNMMIAVLPSNKKLYDRAARYVARLAGVSYVDACRAVFRVMDHLRPRIVEGRDVPSPVLLAAVTLLGACEVAEAEARLAVARENSAPPEALIAVLKAPPAV